jgi:hypothetical protein
VFLNPVRCVAPWEASGALGHFRQDMGGVWVLCCLVWRCAVCVEQSNGIVSCTGMSALVVSRGCDCSFDPMCLLVNFKSCETETVMKM